MSRVLTIVEVEPDRWWLGWLDGPLIIEVTRVDSYVDSAGVAWAVVEGWRHLAHAFLNRRERYRESLHHAEQALDLYRAAGDRGGQANALNNIAVARTALGDHAAAISLCRQAMSVYEELGDQLATGMAWDSLGAAYQHAGDHRQAEACCRQAIARFGDFGDSYLEADTRIRLGDVQAAAGDPAGARDTWHRALAVLVELRHPDADQVRAKLDQPEAEATPSIRAGRS